MIDKGLLLKLFLFIGVSCVLLSLINALPFRDFVYKALFFFIGLILCSMALALWRSEVKK